MQPWDSPASLRREGQGRRRGWRWEVAATSSGSGRLCWHGPRPFPAHTHLGRGTVSPLDPSSPSTLQSQGQVDNLALQHPAAPCSLYLPHAPRVPGGVGTDLLVRGAPVNASLLRSTDSFGFHQILSIEARNAELQSSGPQTGREPISERKDTDDLGDLRGVQERETFGGT